MSKKKITIFLTISAVLSWLLIFLFVFISDYITDIPYIIFLFIVPLITMLCINWYIKLFLDKIRKKEIRYGVVNIILSVTVLIPSVIVSLWDIFINTSWLAGLIGFFFLLFISVPALLILVSSIIYVIKNKKG